MKSRGLKRWPAASFAAVADRMHTDSIRPLLIEGPQDRAVCGSVQHAANCTLPIACDLSVASLAALLQRCAAYVGNDSGPSHLAGLLGLPTLAVFGPTDPALWSPVGPRVRVLRALDSSLAQLSPEAVIVAVRELLATRKY